MGYSGSGWSSDSRPPKWWDDVGQWMGSPYGRWQMSRLPVVGDFMRAMDQQKYYNDYFRNTGLSWNDVKYPALLGGQNAFGAGTSSGYAIAGGMISRNLMRLYR